jgi:UDP-N-acetylmuramate--alanine ligase
MGRNLNFDELLKIKNWHLVGIGGAGMSAIARVLLQRGFNVSGSDLKESRFTKALSAEGARIFIGHDSKNVEGAEALVYSSAIPLENPEIKEAEKRGIHVLSRADMLSFLTKEKETIAVAGTHGKTTTTSLVARVLEGGGFDPAYIIGGELNDIGSNARWGKGSYFVVEADESDGSFLKLSPKIAVITNIEADHLDYYRSFHSIVESFKAFVEKVKDDGLVFACGDHSVNSQIFSEREIFTYGFGSRNYIRADSVEMKGNESRFEVYRANKLLGEVFLKIPGKHNILNSLAALGIAFEVGIPFKKVKESLGSFSGVQRRFQLKGKEKGITVVDDYAHHPSEIKATLEAASLGKWNRIICIFQPHRYTRTQFLAPEFASAFDLADWLILTEVYAAGEEPIPGVNSKLILEAVLSHSPKRNLAFFPTLSEAKNFVLSIAKEGDLVLTLGAGDITLLGEQIINELAG